MASATSIALLCTLGSRDVATADRLVSHLLGHDTITVSTGTKNFPARQLYELLGFTQTGECEIADDVTVTTYERKA